MFCTFPRMRTLTILCGAFAAAMPAVPTSAQSAPPANSPAQSVIHIQVVVVPVLMPPHHRKHKDRDDDAVIYSLDTQRETMSVTEQIRPMLVEAGGSVRQEQVLITTVVAR